MRWATAQDLSPMMMMMMIWPYRPEKHRFPCPYGQHPDEL